MIEKANGDNSIKINDSIEYINKDLSKAQQLPTPCMCHGAGAEIIIFIFASTTSHTQTLVAIFRKNQGTNKMNLDNVKMNVVETAKNGVVDQATIFSFAQTD
ncbi:MAG: hypothetical protein O9294_17485, partial [Cytophagales bacterium]|nr:hypothetical protein [Cytophagales bacterium]